MVLIGSCTKENIEPSYENKSSNTHRIIQNNPDTINEARKGQIACSVYDSYGTIVCAGVRCGTPRGDCGRKFTECECVSRVISIENKMSNIDFKNFQKLWNSENEREKLKIKGYFSKDI